MNLFTRFYIRLKKYILRKMAKITIETEGGKEFSFSLADLIYVGLDDQETSLVVVLKGQAPLYFPLTPGNIIFLESFCHRVRVKSTNDLKFAKEKMLEEYQISQQNSKLGIE